MIQELSERRERNGGRRNGTKCGGGTTTKDKEGRAIVDFGVGDRRWERGEKTKRKLKEERPRGVRENEVDLMEDRTRGRVTPMEGARRAGEGWKALVHAQEFHT